MLGELRFQPPMPAKPWGAELDATRNSCISPQNRSRLAAAMGDFEFPQDEDCLTLNICAPRDTRGNLPVVVWLHGGAFSSGAGSLPWYSGENMARNRSEENTSELQSLMRISYAVFCVKKKNKN